MALPTSPPEVSSGATTAVAVPLRTVLETAVAHGASDVHIRVGAPPLIRVSGLLCPLELPALSEADCARLVGEALAADADRLSLRDEHEADFALTEPGVGRFRVNAYRTRGSDAMVLRHVKEQIPTIADLGLPAIVADLAHASAGLILVCGPTGSGKTTTLAAMIDAINESRPCHILTIEDPIEFLHANKRASVSQRELHTDTSDFGRALRAAMRQDPDVILVGEIRDVETMRTALQAAETGHLVLASLHSQTVVDAVNRIMDIVPMDEQRQARASLAESVQGIVCQHLVPSARGDGRTMVMEIATGTPRVKDAIADPAKTALLSEIIAEGDYYGMRTFEQDAVRLVLSGAITVSVAEKVVPRVADLHVALRRAGYRE